MKWQYKTNIGTNLFNISSENNFLCCAADLHSCHSLILPKMGTQCLFITASQTVIWYVMIFVSHTSVKTLYLKTWVPDVFSTQHLILLISIPLSISKLYNVLTPLHMEEKNIISGYSRGNQPSCMTGNSRNL